MAKYGAFLVYNAFSIFILTMSFLCKATDKDRKVRVICVAKQVFFFTMQVHIVYLGSLLDGEYSPMAHHHLNILQSVVQGSSPENLLVRSYKRSFNGFAAKLTDQEREKLAKMKEVVSVFPSRTFQLQTTRSWEFMGLNEKVSRNSVVESVKLAN